ncbi:MAG: hypothetical protein HN916_03265 [Anaerolineae bacterium]|jgi:hypothetical protein|nr:hypothetical protein [Anaerolineae bacterium]MBT7991264.1 hypothetical protein [Anaerolineae bacterium]
MKKTTIIILLTSLLIAAAPRQAPEHPIKLIFIHHSTGENWLTDSYGDLGRTLGENNYFVSDTNYGWGPNSIGDRTDIPNWVEWFASEETPTYMNALFNESGQHSEYTRTLADPGGENEIIMFKSCFPNSALKGSISDPPTPEGWLTIGNAKYVYNTILEYFVTRPDKLFIVITAPPLSDPTYADNARAFNNWLKNEWLADYAGSNVAVFDFYDVLTGPSGGNTLYYPTGDDHPSAEGSRLATTEFIPALNAAYNRWQAGDTSVLPVDEETAPSAETETQPEASTAPFSSTNLIDDFEGDAPPNSYGWQAFKDDASSSQITCATTEEMANLGTRSLKIDYNVELYSWSTCYLSFDDPQNWSEHEGISFYAYAAQEETPFNVDLFVESESYVYQGWVERSGNWYTFTIYWDEFKRVDWEENAGAPFAKTEQVTGLAFGFNTPENTEIAPIGTLYIDDLMLGESSAEEVETPAENTEETTAAEDKPQPEAPAEGEPVSSPLPCVGGLVLPIGLAGLAFGRRKK